MHGKKRAANVRILKIAQANQKALNGVWKIFSTICVCCVLLNHVECFLFLF